MNYVEGLYDIMQYFEKSNDSYVLYEKFYTITEGWDLRRKQQISSILTEISFFCRLDSKCIEENLEKIKIDIIQKDKLLHWNITSQYDSSVTAENVSKSTIKDENISEKPVSRLTFYQRNLINTTKRKVYIIIKGCIVIKNHDEDVLLPKSIAKLVPGDIIGAQKIDTGLSNKKEIFYLALVDTEVAIIDEDDFYYFWNWQKISELEKTIFFLKSSPFFSELCDQTIYLIVYEFLWIKSFEPNTMILAQAKRSPLNFFYKAFYQNMISKIGMKIIRSNEKRIKEQDQVLNQNNDFSRLSISLSSRRQMIIPK